MKLKTTLEAALGGASPPARGAWIEIIVARSAEES